MRDGRSKIANIHFTAPVTPTLTTSVPSNTPTPTSQPTGGAGNYKIQINLINNN